VLKFLDLLIYQQTWYIKHMDKFEINLMNKIYSKTLLKQCNQCTNLKRFAYIYIYI
jgi:hypothetical protein